MATGSGLALASTGARPRVHDKHQPDAHSTSEIELIHWGVEMARKGGVPKDRVLNCLELPNFSAYLNQGALVRAGRHPA